MGAFFVAVRRSAGQLTPLDWWYLILSRAPVKYPRERKLEPPWRIQIDGPTTGVENHPADWRDQRPTAGFWVNSVAILLPVPSTRASHFGGGKSGWLGAARDHKS